jgi:hypothetical protein
MLPNLSTGEEDFWLVGGVRFLDHAVFLVSYLGMETRNEAKSGFRIVALITQNILNVFLYIYLIYPSVSRFGVMAMFPFTPSSPSIRFIKIFNCSFNS